MFKFLMTGLVALFLVPFFLASSPASAGHCKPYDAVFNELISLHPGSKRVALYDSLDALVYLGFLNGYPTGAPFMTGNEVIVFAKESYDSVIAFVFHDGCLVAGVPIPIWVHDTWNEMVVGVEASDDGPT